MSVKFPFLKFYPNDWLSDQGLRMCSLAARGVWIELLCVMWKSPRRGYLESAEGVPISAEQLARVTGERQEVVLALLAELESAGVFSREKKTDIIFSRRIVKDVAFLNTCSLAGRKGGGNPTFKGTPKGHDKGRPKPQKSEVQKSEVQSSIAPTGARSDEAITSKEVNLRKRDPLLDVFATIGGLDLRQLTKSAWGAARKALAEIKDVCPTVTPEEIQRRAQVYRQNLSGAKLTPTALSKWWADCDRASKPAPLFPAASIRLGENLLNLEKP